MINELFEALTADERQAKLKTVLRNKTGDLLTADELKAVMDSVRPDKQHSIHVYHDFDDMITDIIRSAVKRILFIVGNQVASQQTLQQLLFEAALEQNAIMAVVEQTMRKDGVFVYVPIKRVKRGFENQ